MSWRSRLLTKQKLLQLQYNALYIASIRRFCNVKEVEPTKEATQLLRELNERIALNNTVDMKAAIDSELRVTINSVYGNPTDSPYIPIFYFQIQNASQTASKFYQTLLPYKGNKTRIKSDAKKKEISVKNRVIDILESNSDLINSASVKAPIQIKNVIAFHQQQKLLIDIGLQHGDNTVLVIETKQRQKSKKANLFQHVYQCMSYCAYAGTRYGIITDGKKVSVMEVEPKSDDNCCHFSVIWHPEMIIKADRLEEALPAIIKCFELEKLTFTPRWRNV
eukprot:164218_1